MLDMNCNSRFYHSFSSSRRYKNGFVKISNEEGREMEEQDQISEEKWRNRCCSVNGWPSATYLMEENDKKFLMKDLVLEEVEEVVFNSRPNISPGNESISYSFIKKFCCFIKNDI